MRLRETIDSLQDLYLLSAHGLAGVARRPRYWGEAVSQMDRDGAGSLLIVLLLALFIGMALSLQLAAELRLVGLDAYTGKVVGISIVREVGPVFVALVYAGRAGAGMASELGSMVLGHQVDTLRVFGVDPVKKLVTPRLLSALVMLPVLTVIGDAAALLGSLYIVRTVVGQSATAFWRSIRDVLTFRYVFAGALKPFVFGFLITAISCHAGLATSGGATGLRHATTRAFVRSVIAIIVSDFVLTKVLLYLTGYSV